MEIEIFSPKGERFIIKDVPDGADVETYKNRAMRQMGWIGPGSADSEKGFIGRAADTVGDTIAGLAQDWWDWRKRQPSLREQTSTPEGMINLGMGFVGGPMKLVGPAVKGVMPPSAFNAEKLALAMSEAKTAGTPLSLGQATESKLLSGMESTTARVGGIGTARKFGETQALKMGEEIERKAATLAPKMEESMIGKVITTDLTGPAGFVERFRNTSNNFYNIVDAKVPPTTPMKMTSTGAYLDDAVALIPGAEASSAMLTNPKLKEFYRALVTDAAAGQKIKLTPEQIDKFVTMKPSAIIGAAELPYQVVSGMRSAIGMKLSGAGIIDDIPRGELKRLYGALSDDIRSGIATGAPSALPAWERANNFYKAGVNHIDKTIDPIIAAKVPENIIAGLQRDATKGSTAVRELMSSLSADKRPIVSAYILREMGAAKPGASAVAQPSGGFSIQTFSTNWSRLDEGARRVMFDNVGGKAFRQDLDSVVNTANRIIRGSQVIANPSGTAAAVTQTGQATALGTSIFTGNLEVAGAIGAAIVGSNLTLRMMLNPRVVSWLANSTNAPSNLWMLQAAKLAKSFDDSDPDLAADLRRLARPPSSGNPFPEGTQ